MNNIVPMARRALLVAIGMAAATFSTSYDQTISAADSPLMQALELPQRLPTIQPVAYTTAAAIAEDEDATGEVSLEERFDAMVESMEEFEESLDEVAEVAGNDSIVVSGSSKSTMKVVGRVHADAWGFDISDADRAAIGRMNGNEGDPQNRLGFRRVRFGVRGDIQDNMEYRIEMEFASGNDSEFRDVWLGWKHLPVLQKVLLGNQKRPYGLDHLNSSRFNVFLERPFVIESFNQDARRLGIGAYGVSDDQRWNWRYGVFNQELIQASGQAVGDHLNLQVAGRLANTIWYDDVSGGRGYAHWAVSGSHADSGRNPNLANFNHRPEARSEKDWLNTGPIDNADHYELIGFENVVNIGALQIVGEYQSVWVDRDGASDVRLDGGYAYVSYFLTGEHMPWSRSSGTLARIVPFQNFWLVDRCDGCREAGWGAWQIAARYSYADFNDDDIFGGKGESFTFGLNWYWNPNARMQFNYINGRIEDVETVAGPLALDSGDYNIFGARFMVDF